MNLLVQTEPLRVVASPTSNLTLCWRTVRTSSRCSNAWCIGKRNCGPQTFKHADCSFLSSMPHCGYCEIIGFYNWNRISIKSWWTWSRLDHDHDSVKNYHHHLYHPYHDGRMLQIFTWSSLDGEKRSRCHRPRWRIQGVTGGVSTRGPWIVGLGTGTSIQKSSVLGPWNPRNLGQTV